MYKKMLVPLDGSKLAEVVIPYVKEIAERLGLDLLLLHVCTPQEREFSHMRESYIHSVAQAIGSQVEQVQQRPDIRPGAKPVNVRSELTIGYPAEEILRHAEQKNIDLIVMATHGRSGIKDWLFGSVADKVLRGSKIPVCLIRAKTDGETSGEQWLMRTILVPLDGSQLAERVLPHLQNIAKVHGDITVSLLRVVPPLRLYAYAEEKLSPQERQRWERDAQDNARQYLQKIAKRLKKDGIRVKCKVIYGDTVMQLVDYANKKKVDLLVISTHGRSGVLQWVWGGVTDKILQLVSCPILLVRPGTSL